MSVSATKMTILTVFGAIGSFIANIFGGWGEDMITLLIFMGTDFLLGLLIAAFWKKSISQNPVLLALTVHGKGWCEKE